MSLSFEHAWCLLLLGLAVVPWLRAASPHHGYPAVDLLPPDLLSRLLDTTLKLLGSAALIGCALGLAAPYTATPPALLVGRGAQIVVLLDRSRSMDEPFAGRVVAGAVMTERAFGGYESKGAAARRQLAEFARHREHDLVSMVAFTNIAIPIIGFTPHQELVQAAIRAGNEGRGLAETDVGLGLLAAAAQFTGQPYNGSRVILLVSDGGARLEPEMQRRIAAALQREHIVLYWLYLRTNRSPGLLADAEVGADAQDQVPEHFLHQFFMHMGTPYHAYEAEDPAALQRAVADVDRLERLPFRYQIAATRRSRSDDAYAVALGCAVLLFLGSLAESRRKR